MFNNNKKEMIELKDQYASLAQSFDLLKQENSNYKQTISAFVGVQSGYEAEISKLKQAHSAELSKLNQNLEMEKLAVNRRINKALADIGVGTFAPEEISTVPENNAEAIHLKFTSLTGTEKAEYFTKHEKELSNLFNLRT